MNVYLNKTASQNMKPKRVNDPILCVFFGSLDKS